MQKVIYSNCDPNASGVDFVAIQMEENQPYVFGTCNADNGTAINRWLGDGLQVIPVHLAMKRYQFERGELPQHQPV